MGENLNEKKHFIRCEECGQWVDMRNLDQVFEHLHAGLKAPDWVSSIRVGEPTEYLKDGGEIDLN